MYASPRANLHQLTQHSACAMFCFKHVMAHPPAQVLGDNLLSLIKLHDYRGIPIPTVKRITRQVCAQLQGQSTRTFGTPTLSAWYRITLQCRSRLCSNTANM